MNLSRLESFAAGRASSGWLATLAFFNSFLLPVPAETLLVPLCVSNPQRSWWYASVATFSSVTGGMFGYAIGALAFAEVGSHLVTFYGSPEEFQSITDQFNRAGAQWILLATISPIPYKLVTITSGVTHLDLRIFLAASLLGRVIGYFSIAIVCWRFGEQAKRIITTATGKTVGLVVLLIMGLFLTLS